MQFECKHKSIDLHKRPISVHNLINTLFSVVCFFQIYLNHRSIFSLSYQTIEIFHDQLLKFWNETWKNTFFECYHDGYQSRAHIKSRTLLQKIKRAKSELSLQKICPIEWNNLVTLENIKFSANQQVCELNSNFLMSFNLRAKCVKPFTIYIQ